MTRYRHIVSGARVSVRDDKALGSEWEPVEDGEKKSPAKRTARKSTSKSE